MLGHTKKKKGNHRVPLKTKHTKRNENQTRNTTKGKMYEHLVKGIGHRS